MSWTVVRDPRVSQLLDDYERSIAERYERVTSEREAQKLLSDDEAWRLFNEDVKAKENSGDDPSALFKPVFILGSRRPNYFQHSRYGLTIVYRRDADNQRTIPVLFCRNPDCSAELEKSLSLLP